MSFTANSPNGSPLITTGTDCSSRLSFARTVTTRPAVGNNLVLALEQFDDPVA